MKTLDLQTSCRVVGAGLTAVGLTLCWRGRRIGLAAGGLGITLLAISYMGGKKSIHIIPKRQLPPPAETLATLLQAIRGGDEGAKERLAGQYNDLKSEGFKTLTVEDVDTLRQLDKFENASAMLNVIPQLGVAETKWFLYTEALEATDNCVDRVLSISAKLPTEVVPSTARQALSDYALRAKADIASRIELAKLMLRLDCDEQQIAQVMDRVLKEMDHSALMGLLSPELVRAATAHTSDADRWRTQLVLACDTTDNPAALLLAASENVRPGAEEIYVATWETVGLARTMYGLLQHPLFDEVAARFKQCLSHDEFQKALDLHLDGPLGYNATAETVQWHAKWVEFMFKIAPQDFDWPTKDQLLKEDNVSEHLVPLARSLEHDDWSDQELLSIAPKLPAVLYFSLPAGKRQIAVLKLDHFVRGQVSQCVAEVNKVMTQLELNGIDECLKHLNAGEIQARYDQARHTGLSAIHFYEMTRKHDLVTYLSYLPEILQRRVVCAFAADTLFGTSEEGRKRFIEQMKSLREVRSDFYSTTFRYLLESGMQEFWVEAWIADADSRNGLMKDLREVAPLGFDWTAADLKIGYEPLRAANQQANLDEASK